MSACLVGVALPRTPFQPVGVPVRRGRVSLRRYLDALSPDESDGAAHATWPRKVVCLAQFGGVVWIGPASNVPRLPGVVRRDFATLDAKGRVTIPDASRCQLALPAEVVDDFRADVDVAPMGGVYLCPVDGYESRKESVRNVGA